MTKIEQDASQQNPNGDILVLAHVIFRHGARNIVATYPSDPYKDESHWPGGFGQITEEGKMQQYKLGQYFRRRYGKILGDKYTPNCIYVQSTDVDRTLMSALANLAGLFPPTSDEEIWNPDIKWQPIPVHTIPIDMDYMLANGRPCPSFQLEFETNVEQSPEVQRICKDYADLFLSWSQNSGVKIKTIPDVDQLHNILTVEKEQNKLLPAWAEEAIEPNGVMGYITKLNLTLYTATPFLKRIVSGFLIKKIFDSFSQKINSTLKLDRPLFLYSAHDVTIANFLNSLGLFEPHLPSYASSVHIELYKTTSNQHYVQMFYRNSNEEHLQPLNVPGCGTKFSVQQFLDNFKEIIPQKDFVTECGSHDSCKKQTV